MLGAAAWTVAVSSGYLEAIDQRVFDFMSRHRTPAGVTLMVAVSYLGSEYITPLLILGTALLARRRSGRWFVVPFETTNDTLVNGALAAPGREVAIAAQGDVLALGGLIVSIFGN